MKCNGTQSWLKLEHGNLEEKNLPEGKECGGICELQTLSLSRAEEK
jgi:hypothetical protein